MLNPYGIIISDVKPVQSTVAASWLDIVLVLLWLEQEYNNNPVKQIASIWVFFIIT